MICKRITINGKVQGVFFRASAKEKADELHVKGEVRNLPDGRVEVIACGNETQVQRLVEWCYDGPPRAEVMSVDVTDIGPIDFDGFRVVRR
jgi:acylphosphatase